jgi:hypothetical protein
MTAARKPKDMIAIMAVTVAESSIGSSFPIGGAPSSRPLNPPGGDWFTVTGSFVESVEFSATLHYQLR